MLASYLAILHGPFGDVVAIIYSYPVVTLFLAHFILNERQSPWKLISAFILCFGIILVVKPNFIFGPGRNLSFGFIMAFIGALATGLHNICLHHLKEVETSILVFWSGMMGLLECLAFTFWNNGEFSFLQTEIHLDGKIVFNLVLLGLLGAFATWTSNASYQTLSSTTCAFLRSQEIILAYIVQIFIFEDLPTVLTAIGSTLILLSGIMISVESSSPYEPIKSTR